MRTTICEVLRLGLVPYETAWKLQARLAAEVAAGERHPTLLLLEHPHTYTFGRRGDEKNLLWDAAELDRRGVSVHWVDRGGDVTYHGPGQLVGYPLVSLSTGTLSQVDAAKDATRLPKADYVGYLRKLEQTLIAALARFGVASQRIDGLTGVWVRRGDTPPAPQEGGHGTGFAKIAAIGVKVDARGVTRHGFALNVDPDMSYWQGITACGLVGHAVTSMREILASPPTMQQVIEAVIRAFGDVFGYEMQESRANC